MTNYNERLDGIFKTLNNKAREERASCTERNNWEGYNFAYERLENEAKQAITSLIKELVAGAKPEKHIHHDAHGKPFEDAQDIAYNTAIEQFEQNLLKALEKV